VHALLAQNQVIKKSGLIDQPQRELDSVLFLQLKSNGLTAPTEINLPYLHPPWQGGGSAHSPEILPTLVQLFIIFMITSQYFGFRPTAVLHKPADSGIPGSPDHIIKKK
jgi:hypothetical protein